MKYVCSVCGYVYEGDNPPEFCPQCKAPASKFTVKQESADALSFVTVHGIGDGKVDDPPLMPFRCCVLSLFEHFTSARAAEKRSQPSIDPKESFSFADNLSHAFP